MRLRVAVVVAEVRRRHPGRLAFTSQCPMYLPQQSMPGFSLEPVDEDTIADYPPYS
jgi:hypothetical protein